MPGIADKSRKALTLVELMAAMAIVALLLTSALAVLGKLSRANQIQGRRHDESTLVQPLRDLLRIDLVHAKYYSEGANDLMFKSSACLDNGTLVMNHLDLVVVYRTVQLGRSMCLIRSQHPGVPGKSLDELVCVGVRSLKFEIVSDGQTAAAAPSDPDTWQPVPGAMAVTIGFEDERRQPLRVVVQNY